jgi:hypothetical protein
MDAEKIAKITGHRFAGYTPGMLAIEVEQFQSGAGASTIAEAVEALKAVATSLADTDEALRQGLKEIGVSWQSGAAEQAKGIFGGNADFAGDAHSKVNNSAQAAFVLSEAYTSMVNKLPDPAVLRAGDDGLNLGDVLGGLIGHETDNAARVTAARAARDQAVDALTEFQQTCADELSGVDVLDSPQNLLLDDGSGAGPVQPGDPSIATSAAALTDGVAPTPDSGTGDPGRPTDAAKGSTASASASSPPRGGWEHGGRGTVGPGTVPDCPEEDDPAPSQRSGAVSGSGDGGGSGPAGSTSPSGTYPSAGPVTGGVGVLPVPGGGSSPGGGSGGPGAGPGGPGAPGVPGAGTPGGGTGSPGVGPGGVSPGPGGAVITPGVGAGGSSSGGAAGGGSAGAIGAGGSGGSSSSSGSGGPGKAGGFGGGPGGKLGGFGGGLPGGGAPEAAEPLAKGKLTGVTPPPPSAGGVPPAPVPPAAAAGAGAGAGLASGAAAVAAGAVAGATSGEEDRERRTRGLGKDTDVDGRPLHELEVGEIPDEQDADNVEKVEPEPAGDEPQYLEQAAVQPGVTDTTRVRSQPVDDVDVFADQRLVAPEVIGDDPAAAYQANRTDSSP